MHVKRYGCNEKYATDIPEDVIWLFLFGRLLICRTTLIAMQPIILMKVPIMSTWDDHETDDNLYGQGAISNI